MPNGCRCGMRPKPSSLATMQAFEGRLTALEQDRGWLQLQGGLGALLVALAAGFVWTARLNRRQGEDER